jgi:acyl carrier protein
MSEPVEDAVYAALARHLRSDAAAIRASREAPLEDLGLDSHSLLRVLLDIERALGLGHSLELPDEGLASPAAMAGAIAAVVAGR